VKPVDWISETKFVVDGLEFGSDLASFTEKTTRDRVVILKESRLLREYLDFLAPHKTANILELGIWQGGSSLFYGMATDARRVVAIDLGADKHPAIEEIIAERALGDRIKLHFGVSQDDRDTVRAIIEREFSDEPLDLVIDDASHQYDYSRRSFEIVFPRLREGGLYIIEDWNWAHYGAEIYQSGEKWGDNPALTNLIFELLIAYGSHSDIFSNIVVRPGFVAIRKGSRQLDDDFRLDDLLRMRGKKLTLI
jgi:predicted O-methyltransferase YrrM